jgi:hypothetical protein
MTRAARLLCGIACFAGLSLIGAEFTNGGFEHGLDGWRLWSRDYKAATIGIENSTGPSSGHMARVEHSGSRDWSLEPASDLVTREGELYEIEARVRRSGEGAVTLCVSTWVADKQVGEWSYASRSAAPGDSWQLLRTRVVVPEGVVRVQPRIIGDGPATVWVDDFIVKKLPDLWPNRRQDLRGMLTVTNGMLALELNTTNALITVTDSRSHRAWEQRICTRGTRVLDATNANGEIHLRLGHGASGLELSCVIRLSATEPEFTLELNGDGELPGPLAFPHPFQTHSGEWLVVPMNEGIAYPVEDQTIPLHRLITYGGHGICMAFWGVTDGVAGHMGIFETADDAAIRMDRVDGKTLIAPEWDPQKHRFGYTRKIRYVFFDKGGHVAIAKRYRAWARERGLVRTLAEKRQVNPNVDLLIGAVNVWCWDKDAVSIVKEMREAGIERILWSNRQSRGNLKALNELGVLTSRYDIYQDAMNPAEFSKLRWIHSDWTTNAWPDDLILGANNQWIKGWGVEAKDGTLIHCGVLCDKQALPYAKARAPQELADSPYRARFIDTTTASPWNECYAPAHPMTRTDSREAKMALLNYFSHDLNLVTGCETGHEAAVPFLHYFEGMLSLGPYRVPDAGRRMNVLWTNVPEVVAKYQLGQYYRLPLWELVYHDCVVAQWYWGDYNNKLPSLWDKRDLFNLLYGTPPMFMFDRKLWTESKDRFVQSYRNTCPHVRDLGYSEMIDHRFLTPNREVQQTAFSSGHKVTVNFGSSPFALPDGTKVAGMGFVIQKN